MPDDSIGTTEAAEILGIDPRNVRRHCRIGTFETARQSGKTWLISRAEVEQYAAAVENLSKTDPRRGKGASDD